MTVSAYYRKWQYQSNVAFHSKTIFESDLRRRHSKVIFEDDLQLSLILSSLTLSLSHSPFRLSLSISSYFPTLADLFLSFPLSLSFWQAMAAHHTHGLTWSSGDNEVVGAVGAVIGGILFLGIVHFCRRWCHPSQSDQHGNNSNLELGPPPELP